jgi:hypothetical protein
VLPPKEHSDKKGTDVFTVEKYEDKLGGKRIVE